MAGNAPLLRRLATELNALVGDITTGEELGARPSDLASAWNELGGVALALSGAQLAIGEHVVLQGASERALWILPAWIAGVRRITPHGTLTVTEIVGLATALAGLQRSHGSIRTFQAWLWAGGSVGFDVDVQSSLLDRLDALSPTDGARQKLDSGRGRTAQNAAISYAKRRQEQDILRQQAEQRLGELFRSLGDSSLVMTAVSAKELRQSAEDGVFWAEQLVEAATSQQELLGAFPSQRAARWVLDGFVNGPSLDALDAVASLLAPQDEPPAGDDDADGGEPAEDEGPRAWLERVLAGISDADLGRAVGRGLVLDQAAIERLSTMMRDIAVPFSSGVATGLLTRAGDSEAAVKEVVALCQAVGLRQVWSHAELKQLSEPVARGIAMVLKIADAGDEFYGDLVLESPATVAAWILRNAPANVRSRIESRMHALFRTRDPIENAPLVQALIATGSTSSIRALAEVFVRGKGKGWAGRIVPELCAAIVEKGLGEEHLVALFRDRDAEPKLRLLVLRSLDDHPHLLASAVKFRATDLMESKEIQARLKAARKKLKGG